MQIQELADYTAQILLDYYENRIQPFLDACDEDVLWIGPAVGQVIRTKKALVAAFAAEKHELRFAVHNLTATLLPTGSSHVMNILLSFLVDTFWPDGSSVRVYQRIVFTWVFHNNTPYIRLCHISNAIAYDKRDRIYPVHYEETYRDQLVLAGETRSDRLRFRGTQKTLIYLNWSSILYAETHGRHTILHTTDQVYESVERLSALAERYGAFFIRCHESYLINPSFVQKISRFQVQMTDGRDHPDPGEKIYRSEGSSAAPPTFFQPYFTTPFFKMMLAY